MNDRISTATTNATPCGLSRDELETVRAPIDQALALPARAYTSADFLELEIAHIFQRHWVGVCFEVTLPNPGDMRPVELFGRPLVLIRGDDGVLRAFHNVCPYDGCLAVLSEHEAASEIEVYYHGWQYDLRGRLSAIPYWDGTPEGHLHALGEHNGNLVEIRSQSRLGILFIDLGAEAGSLDDHLAPLYRVLDEYNLDDTVQVEDDGTLARQGRIVEGNWKTYLENAAINILHESFTHEAYRKSPEVPRARDGEKTFFTIRDDNLLAFGFRMQDFANTYASGGSTPHLGRSRSDPPTKGFFVTLYPNLVMPTRVNMVRLGICLPETPGKTRILQCGSFHPDAPLNTDFSSYHRGLAKRYEQVYEEDRIAIEAVQRGRSSPVWQQHFYAPFWDELHYGLNNLVATDLDTPPSPRAAASVGVAAR